MVGWLVDHPEHPHQPGETLLQRGVQRPKRPQRPRGDQQGGNEAGEIAQRVRADRGPPAFEADHQRHGSAAQHLQHRIDGGAPLGHPHQRAKKLGERRLGAVLLRLLQPIGAHRPGLREALVQQRGGLARPLLHPAGGAAHPLADALDRHRRQRIHHRADQRQHPVEIQHRGHQPDHRDDISHALHRAGERVANDGGIRREPGRKLGRRFTLQPGQVGVNKVREHPPLQFADHQQDHALHLDALEILRRRLDGGNRHHQRRDLVQDARVAAGEHGEGVVDHHRIQCGRYRPSARSAAGPAGAATCNG